MNPEGRRKPAPAIDFRHAGRFVFEHPSRGGRRRGRRPSLPQTSRPDARDVRPMNTKLLTAPLVLAAAAVAAPAQQIASPPGVSTPTLGGSSGMRTFGSSQPVGDRAVRPAVRPQFGRPIHGRPAQIYPVQPLPTPYPQPGPYPQPHPRPTPGPYPGPPAWGNPVIDRDGFVDAEYDPYTGITDLNRQSIETRRSALDPNRHVVDPGSFRRIDRWINVNGRTVREHGTAWTSYGVPHSNITRDSTTYVPGGGPGGPTRINDREVVVRSVPNGPGGPTRINDSHTTIRSVQPPAPGGLTQVNDRETVIKY